MPDVSVIIPTYNRLDFLKTAIASCFDGNDGIDIEVVVVDDGSTDGTCEWLREQGDTRVQPIFQEHKGAQHARNNGLDQADGATIKFLDSDDYLYPSVLEKQYNALTETEADVCYGPIDITDGESVVQDRRIHPPVDDLMGAVARGRITTYPHVFLYKRSTAVSGRWRTEVPFHQDTAYVLDLGVHAPTCVRCEVCVGIHRAHDGKRITTTAKAVSSTKNIRYKFALLKEAFDRRSETGNMRPGVKQDVLSGMWTEAHKIAISSFDDFREMWSILQSIDPTFRPYRSSLLLKMLDTYIGVEQVESIINPLRLVKQKVRT